jgi:mono/diheme cytochrome c family protein
MVMKRIVMVVQLFTAAAAVWTVASLGLRQPPELSFASEPGAPIDGGEIYAQACAGCHGTKGEGQYGKKLSGGAVMRAFPDAAAQVKVVRDGRGLMPGFKSSLDPAQIEAVVDYTRTTLQEPPG